MKYLAAMLLGCVTLAFATATSSESNASAFEITPYNAEARFAAQASPLLQSYGLSKSEFAATVALPTFAGNACPGFHVASASPGKGFRPGMFGLQFILIDGTGDLQGGINFGGGFDKKVNGFAAFSINNTTANKQYVDIRILSSYTDTIEVRFTKRTNNSEQVLTQFNARFTTQLSAPVRVYVTSGFHVLTVRPVGATATNSDSVFNASIITGFDGAPGGAFAGGAVVGGLLSTNPNTSAFAAICIPVPTRATISVFGTPSYGALGGDGARVRIVEGFTKTLVYDSEATPAAEYGCYRANQQNSPAQGIGCGLLNSFGNAFFDARFHEEVQIQSHFWVNLPTTVYILDECPGVMNAWSHPNRFILFGRNLTVDTIIAVGSELPIAGILAHEWAHQAQFRFGWSNTSASTSRSTELEADAFSGYYMGLVKGWAGPELSSYFQTLFRIGDYNFNHPSHHGTPEERRAAGALGMQVAANAIYYNRPYSYQELHQYFSSIIKTVIINETPIGYREERLASSAGIDLEYIRKVARDEATLNQIRVPLMPQYQREILFPYDALR